MKTLRITALATFLGLIAAQSHAGGIAFDLPHLTFPAPAPDVTRDCDPVATCLPAPK